jgi:serine/threonine protein phosphatase 1
VVWLVDSATPGNMSSELFKKIASDSDKIWLVGDIHGQYDLLMEQLSKQQFDPNQGHILVSVGDMIDRGPDSLKTLELLTQPWFFAVMGNHEQMLLKGVAALKGGGPILDILNWQALNGGDWYDPFGVIDERQNQKLEALIEKVANLPLAIEIATDQGRLGVVHAAVPNSQWLNTEHLGNELVKKHLLWFRGNGRKILNAQSDAKRYKLDADDHTISGIDRVVVGHTIMGGGEPVFAGNTLYLDVGAAIGLPPAVIRADEVFKLEQDPLLDGSLI